MGRLGHRVLAESRDPADLRPPRAPSVPRPERFPPALRRFARRWATPRRASPLSRVPAPARSFCLSVSGAVAPSAPGFRGPGLSRGDQRPSCLSGVAAQVNAAERPIAPPLPGLLRTIGPAGSRRRPAHPRRSTPALGAPAPPSPTSMSKVSASARGTRMLLLDEGEACPACRRPGSRPRLPHRLADDAARRASRRCGPERCNVPAQPLPRPSSARPSTPTRTTVEPSGRPVHSRASWPRVIWLRRAEASPTGRRNRPGGRLRPR